MKKNLSVTESEQMTIIAIIQISFSYANHNPLFIAISPLIISKYIVLTRHVRK